MGFMIGSNENYATFTPSQVRGPRQIPDLMTRLDAPIPLSDEDSGVL